MFKARLRIIFLVISTFLFFLFARNAVALNPCGELDKSYGGPFDYTDTKSKTRLELVQKFHFTPEVENLIRGKSTMRILGDLNFTLNAFPNHHRALNAVSKYEIMRKEQAAKGGKPYDTENEGGRSVDCYFDRAIRWRPNDPNVHLLYGIHLHRLSKFDQALAAYKISERLQPNSSDLQYNMGLLYFDMKQYALAKEHARKAYQLGYPLPGLRKKLAGVGQWP